MNCHCGNEIDEREVEGREYTDTETICEACYAILAKRQADLDMAYLAG